MAERSMSSNSARATQLGDLREAEVACILQHVPLLVRLKCCALVCSSWAAAATAASADVNLYISGEAERAKQLENWLDKHGGTVRQLAVVDVRQATWLQLPVSKLKHLQRLYLRGFKAQMICHEVGTCSSGEGDGGFALTATSSSTAASSSGSAAAVAVLPQLRELILHECGCTVQLANQLLSATTLTSVHLHSVQMYSQMGSDSLAPERPDQNALSSMELWQRLQQLPQLSTLKLGGLLQAAELSPISSLRGLKHLGVCFWHPNNSAFAAAVAAAPAALTALDLEISVFSNQPLKPVIDKEAELKLSNLSQLLSYRGVWIGIPYDALPVLTALRELRLVNPRGSCALLPHLSTDKLLAALQYLTQLQHLELENCELCTFWPKSQQQQPQDESSHRSFSALTASTQLTALVLVERRGMPVPQRN